MPTKFRLGDKVKFLDSNDAGIICDIGSKYIVVMLPDGMEIPALSAQLVLCSSDNPMIQSPIKIVKKEADVKKMTIKNKKDSIIDLHILDKESKIIKLSGHDPLTVQLNRLTYQIRVAIQRKEPHLVIIHGVGDGILKQSIFDFLKKIPQIKEMRQADPFVYGQGATIVFFR